MKYINRYLVTLIFKGAYFSHYLCTISPKSLRLFFLNIQMETQMHNNNNKKENTGLPWRTAKEIDVCPGVCFTCA